MSIEIKLACPKHPRYKAIQYPRVHCKHCIDLHGVRSEMARIAGMGNVENEEITLVSGQKVKTCARQFAYSPVVNNRLIKAVL